MEEDEWIPQSEQYYESPASQEGEGAPQARQEEYIPTPPQAQEAEAQNQSQLEDNWVRAEEQGPPPQEARDQSKPEDTWVRAEEQGPPPKEAQAAKPTGEPEAEGQLASGAREAAHMVIPGVAGAFAWAPGMAAGAALGSVVPGIGTVAGGIIGGLISAFGAGTAASMSQEFLLKKFGVDDEAQRAANLKENPVATGIGTVAGILPTFGVGGTGALASRVLRGGMIEGDAMQLAARGAGGALGGGIDYAMTGDPRHALAVGAASTIPFQPTALGNAALRAGEQLVAGLGIKGPAAGKISTIAAERIQETGTLNAETKTGAAVDGAATKSGDYPPGRPDKAPGVATELHKVEAESPGTNTPGPVAAPGTAESAAETKKGIISDEAQNQADRDYGNSGKYAKAKAGVTEGGQEPTPLGTIGEDVRAALRTEETKAPVQQAQQEQPPGGPPTPPETPPPPAPPRGPMAREVAPQHLPAYDAGYAGKPRSGNGAEQAAWDRGALDASRAARAARTKGTEPAATAETPVPKAPPGEALVNSLKAEEAKRVAAAENPPDAALDSATQRAVAAAQKHAGTGRAMRQQDSTLRATGNQQPPSTLAAAPAAAGHPPNAAAAATSHPAGPGGPPGGHPPPTAPPPPPIPPAGPGSARLNQPPLLASKPVGWFSNLRRAFAPEFMSPASEKAGAALRRGQGIMQGLNDKWTAKLEKYFPAMEKLVKSGEMDAFVDHAEGGNHFPGYRPPPELQPALDDIRAMMREYKEHAASVSKDPAVVQAWGDKIPHIYKDAAPKSWLDRGGGGGVRGSGGSLKARKYDTYAEAKAQAGHERKHPNILNTLEAYRSEFGKHIALEMAKKEMREGGHLKYATPEENVGASGQLSSLKSNQRIHEDWQPVHGLSINGQVAHMPRDAANVFNNHLSPGLKGNKYIAPFYDWLREAGNRFTGMELGLFNGFHLFVVGHETGLSNQSRGVSELSQGLKQVARGNLRDAGIEFKEGAKSLGSYPVAFATNYLSGLRYLKAAEGHVSSTPRQNAMVKAAQEAGVMPVGRSFAPDENLTSMGTYYQSFMRGQLGRELSEAAARIKDSPFKNLPVEIWNGVGRALQTMSEPLFGHYIPAVKFGTLMKDLESFMRQSKVDLNTPQGHESAVQFLRKQSNAMDVRMGEANMNNTFMNKSIQQSAYLALRSFSWAKGTTTAILGGPGAVAKTVGEGVVNRDLKGAAAKLANKLDMTHKDYDPNLAYSIAFPLGTAILGTAYQLYKTGEMPKDIKDLVLPRTGGMIPGVGGRGDVAERVPLPGYHKEIRGTMHDHVAELWNKRNSLITTAGEQFTGKDWKGHPIVRPDATLTENLTDRAKHIQEKLLNPLMLKNVTATPPEGSKISIPERVLGFKQAGKSYIDPENDEKGARKRYEEAWRQKKDQEYRENQGGRGHIPKSDLRDTYGTKPRDEPPAPAAKAPAAKAPAAKAPDYIPTAPRAPASTLKRAPADEWVRDKRQGPPPR